MKTTLQTAEHYKWGDNCDAWHLLRSGSLSVIRERMPPGASENIHCHKRAQQVFCILSGEALFSLNGENHRVVAGESIHIPAESLHSVANDTGELLEFIVISQPPSHGDRIDIIQYSEDTKAYIKTLNVEWLEKYFRVEENDEIQLSSPKEEILDKGGFIYYARHNGDIVGTASLLRITDKEYELGKMAVTSKSQGMGIGKMLMEHCLNEAKKKGIRKLILYSNTSLTPAIAMYRKYGFHEVELEHGHYERANIKMEKSL